MVVCVFIPNLGGKGKGNKNSRPERPTHCLLLQAGKCHYDEQVCNGDMGEKETAERFVCCGERQNWRKNEGEEQADCEAMVLSGPCLPRVMSESVALPSMLMLVACVTTKSPVDAHDMG